MRSQFNTTAERDVREAQFCRVVIYPAVSGWEAERVLLEVSNSRDTLGKTDPATSAGHYLIEGWDESVLAEVERIRGRAVCQVRVFA